MSIIERLAGAPISWGVCEAPDWGHELAAERVLQDMHELGLRATELGPTGYLGATPAEIRTRLTSHELRLIGGFVPVPLHVDPHADLAEATAAISTLAATGAEVAVLAACSADGSYDRPVRPSEDEWSVLFANLRRLQRVVASHGMLATLHPHVGTAIEDRASVLRLLDGSDIALCLDTGHLFIGGMAPLELLALASDRVAHVHLKDVNAEVAGRVSRAETRYADAVREGLYTPLGEGDLDIASIVSALETAGYRGWYVLEQDVALDGSPADGAGPEADVRRSIEFLTRTTAAAQPCAPSTPPTR